MAVVAELDVRDLELALALDIDLVGAVDHDVGDGLVGQQRLERTEAQHVVEQQLDEVLLLALIEADALLAQDFADQLADLAAEFVAVEAGRRADVDAVDNERLDLELGFLDALLAGAGPVSAGAARVPRRSTRLAAGAPGWLVWALPMLAPDRL